MTTPASRIDTLINKEKERVEVLTVRALSYLGELCVIEARNRPQEISWYDRSGNLRSSIGYAIIHNGKILEYSDFTQVRQGLLGINDTWYKRRFGEITDFNEANNTGYMFVDKTQSLDNKPNTSSNYGFLETIAINEVTIKQTFVDFQSRFFIRICNNGTWTDWKQIQTT